MLSAEFLSVLKVKVFLGLMVEAVRSHTVGWYCFYIHFGPCWVLIALCSSQLMIHLDPEKRPSSSALIKHPVLLTAARMSADQLRVELNAEKFKNTLLQKYVSPHSLATVVHHLDLQTRTLLPSVSDFVFFFYIRELKKAQIAKAAAEEKVVCTERVLTRSSIQAGGRSSRLIGKKMNRSVSLTIY